MNTIIQKPILEQLKLDEGLRLKVYLCTAKRDTIGYGRNLTNKGLSKTEQSKLFGKLIGNKQDVIFYLKNRGITETEAEYLLKNDIKEITKELKKRISFYKKLHPIAQNVLLNMSFNMGVRGLLKFKNTLIHLRNFNYGQASIEMLNSRWARQVNRRALRLSKELESIRFK